MFPAVVDNTIRKSFIACEQKMYNRHVLNLRPNEEKQIDLHFGKCFATGIEVARKDFFCMAMPADWAIKHGIEAAVRVGRLRRTE